MAEAGGAPSQQLVSILGNVAYLKETNPGSVPFSEVGYASVGFLLTMTALVFLMTPGLGLFYSGLSRRKNSLMVSMICFVGMGVLILQWLIWGYSLAFSETATNGFIGNLANAGFYGIGANALVDTAPHIPSVVFALFQMKFCTITPLLTMGSISERFRLIPMMLFMFIWSTIVYCPGMYWTYGYRGWLRNLSCLDTIHDGTPCGVGVLDFAGGGAIHMAGGVAGLAAAIAHGKGHDIDNHPIRPNSIKDLFLGTGLLWFGWFAFNGGAALTATSRAVMAALVTTIGAAAGSMTWLLVDFLETRKLSGVSICSGVVAGLVSVTPGSGFFAPWTAAVVGGLGGVIVNYAARLKKVCGYDDTLDSFAFHGVGGAFGLFMTGIFAQKWIAELDGVIIDGGAIDGNGKQIGYQLIAIVVYALYTFVVTYGLLLGINKIPGCHLRPTIEEELKGGDWAQMGECESSWGAEAPNPPCGPGPYEMETPNHIYQRRPCTPPHESV